MAFLLAKVVSFMKKNVCLLFVKNFIYIIIVGKD